MLTLIGPEVRESGRVLSCQVCSEGKTRLLWYRIPTEWTGLIAETVDPFVTALLPIAMKHGDKIVVGAPLSERLFNALMGPIQDALVEVRPDLQKVEIEPVDLRSNPVRDGEGLRATGFSGGVDSWWVVGQYLNGSNRLDILTFHDVGNHGSGNKGRVLFERRLARARGSSELIGLPLVVVESNLHEFIYSGGLRFEVVHAFANLSVAQALQEGVGEFIYATSYQESVNLRPHHDISVANPVVVPGLGTESLECRVEGGHLSRVERTAEVAQIPESHNRLDVCFNSPEHVINCGRCLKCVRTALTLELLGEMEHYLDAFGMAAYRKVVPAYVRLILWSGKVRDPFRQDPLAMEILDYAEKNGIDLVSTYLGPQEAE